jgi:hypothetical protein
LLAAESKATIKKALQLERFSDESGYSATSVQQTASKATIGGVPCVRSPVTSVKRT